MLATIHLTEDPGQCSEQSVRARGQLGYLSGRHLTFSVILTSQEKTSFQRSVITESSTEDVSEYRLDF